MSPYKSLPFWKLAGQCLGLALLISFMLFLFLPSLFEDEVSPWFMITFCFVTALALIFCFYWVSAELKLKEADAVLQTILDQDIVNKTLTTAADKASRAFHTQEHTQKTASAEFDSYDEIINTQKAAQKALQRFRVLYGIFTKYGFQTRGGRVSDHTSET